MINTSRGQLRELLAQHREQTTTFEDGMQIGKSHSLIVRLSPGATKVERNKQHIIVTLNPSDSLADPAIVEQIRAVVIIALRREAKSYLPKRLAFLAGQLGFEYQKVRFSHASGRWGSCSSNGTISLNIALMKLPFELIDYVLVHELSHTQQMNHSQAFWQLVEQGDPNYKLHRRQLKLETPSI
jgi:predicted metal-dependent hydrolase